MRWRRYYLVTSFILSLMLLMALSLPPTTGSPARTSSSVSPDTITWRLSLDLNIQESSINKLFALDNAHIWAVGSNTIYFYNGVYWSEQYHKSLTTLYGVWASDAKNAWAVGYGYLILHFNGVSWSEQYSDDSTVGRFFGVSGTSSSNVWAVGEKDGSGKCPIVHYDGKSWTKSDSPFTGDSLNDVFALQEDWVLTAGSGGQVGLFDGTTWHPDFYQDPGVPRDYYSIHAIDKQHVWLLGGYYVRFYDGSAWSDISSDHELWTMASSGVDDIWFTGGTGVYHWDGKQISEISVGYNYGSIAVTPGGEVWAARNGDVYVLLKEIGRAHV